MLYLAVHVFKGLVHLDTRWFHFETIPRVACDLVVPTSYVGRLKHNAFKPFISVCPIPLMHTALGLLVA